METQIYKIYDHNGQSAFIDVSKVTDDIYEAVLKIKSGNSIIYCGNIAFQAVKEMMKNEKAK